MVRQSRKSGRRPQAVVFAVVFGISLTWAAGTPMFGVPDEISHMVRAAGAARGDLDGRPLGDGTTRREYLAPAVLEPGGGVVSTSPTGEIVPEDHLRPCYVFNSSVGAECLELTGDDGDTRLYSTATDYPPVYYLAVGWPTRLLDGLPGLYAMRAVSAALFAALVALAVGAIPRGRPWSPAHVGLAVGLTPMVWFMGASVNPTSMAIGAAVAAWCCGMRLVEAGPDERLAGLAWRFGLPLCLLLLTRRDSLLWASMVVVGLAVHLDLDRARRLLRSRHVLGWAGASAACAAYSASVTLETAVGFGDDASSTGSAVEAFGSMPYYLEQMVGLLGWLDTRLPFLAHLTAAVTIGGVVLAALALADRRRAVVLAGMVLSLVAAIVAIGARRHPYFQGRYGLPFAVGIPIVAGWALARTAVGASLPRRPVALLVGAAALVQVTAYYQQFRRYAFSDRTTWWLLDDPSWQPPTAPIAVLVVLHTGLVVGAAWAWYRRGVAVAGPPA